MRAFARFRLPDGEQVDLGHGDLIGRLATAALCLDDARVSEAHAMVSLRGDTLKLLGLRGRFAVDRRPVTEVTLTRGLTVELAPGLPLEVADVVLPEFVLALEAEGLARRVLSGVCSVLTRPRLQLAPGYRADAAAHIWSQGERWRLAVPGEAPIPLEDGVTLTLDGCTLRAVRAPLQAAAGQATRLQGGVHAALRVVAFYDTVHLYRPGEPTVRLNGQMARIVSELVAFAGPVSWETVSREIWKDVEDRHQLRRKWDIGVSRLRARLKEVRVRPDLVRADGTGNVELVLYPGDKVEDRT
ncbi:MAG: hypothetical protein H6739_18530 [Alphaproteobacteria bacterium]|nr:hypothetical protein [Alphaproteobacteria bacterium]